MSAYRIVQEALTNVTRHAPASSALLQVSREPGEMTITVTDDGGAKPGGPSGESWRVPGSGADGRLGGPGLGIAGMRERALLHGGTFSAGPRPDGGFEVVAVLPLEQSRAAANGTGARADGAASKDSAA
jgi:signal transduction histidine kinase